MTSAEIRQSFLDFFKSKQHAIVPSSSLMPDSPNLLFTNAGMNQFVPIFLGQTRCPYEPGRAADTQKCIRAGGKHNDLEDVGLDTYHHTFFEMLGNWSFGDYFKREAIEWAWELVTGVWRFPKNRLYATVYAPDASKGDPSEFDQEAWDFWAVKFREAGLDPAVHIVRGNKKDNFWMMGETGPCGPCSELHVDLTPDGGTRGRLVNAGSAECIEIWNLVFIQYNANADGTFTPLPARHVDTGMGFERVTSILQCTRGFTDFKARISNYETDIFRPIFQELERLSGQRYGSTLPGDQPADVGRQGSQVAVDVAFRVIADHIRTLSFAIADGIQPGNTDRNYVLRRILRRAVRYGRTLGFREPFFYRLVDVVAETMGHVFAEIRARGAHVKEVIRVEEEAFNKTLDRGIELFNTEAARLEGTGATELTGAFAFKLYDTYGFPLDLTELMARERGLRVDGAGFDALMEAQRARARAAQKRTVIELSQVDASVPTAFVGYDQAEVATRVVDVVRLKDRVAVVTEASACYAEMGGQVGDTGELVCGGRLWRIGNTQRSGATWLHLLDTGDGAGGDDLPEPGAPALVRVDNGRRAAIERHHTVTHLLHWALHEVVNREASQKGSFVGPDKLTFDFNSAALSAQQVADLERLVNERILENAAVSWSEVPYAAVKARADVMQFFGEKYGDTVRVVQVGGRAGALDGYSMELCGGTHVGASGEIGLFRIVGESAIAAGVRRIEAVAGLAAYDAAHGEAGLLRSVAATLNTPVGELGRRAEALVAQVKELEKALRAAQQRAAAGRAGELRGRATLVGGVPCLVENLGEVDGDTVQAVAEALRADFRGVSMLAGVAGGAVTLVATVHGDFAKRLQAGKWVGAIAPVVGGKGGGKPDHARGGGKDAAKLGEALVKAREFAVAALTA